MLIAVIEKYRGVKGAMMPILQETQEIYGYLPIEVQTGGSSVDGKYSLDATRCVGACGLAPVMIINNDVYGRVKKDEVDTIIAKY